MFFAASDCAVRLAACVWPEGEQATAVNEDTIWYKEWLIITGMCRGKGSKADMVSGVIQMLICKTQKS